jgi:PhoH-like ATPase
MNHDKIYIIDTNVLVHDPKALFAFEKAHLAIPVTVLEELDHLKEETSDRGRNARTVIRYLDELRERGSLRDGVTLDNDSIIQILFPDYNKTSTPLLQENSADNKILLMALALKEKGHTIEFISKDLNARVKANALGIDAQDYLKDRVSEQAFYHGWIRVTAPSVQLKGEFPESLQEILEHQKLNKNEFVLLESRSNQFNYRVFRYLGSKKFKEVHQPKFSWPLQARNPQQLMALDLLLDKDISLVTLFGPAGTGKTFLALLAGLHQILIEDEYKKMLISRPVVPLGRDIGYLPGDVQEKLHSWMLPIYDNIEFIVHHAAMAGHIEQVKTPHTEHNGYEKNGESYKRRDYRHHLRGGLGSVDELVRKGRLSLEAITYMRGRSIPYQYILIDEVQNLTPHEVKTLITRVGEGSKIILAGDPYQIDSPYLDFSSNGLVVASERFKGEPMFGSVYLESSERSTLSKRASELL